MNFFWASKIKWEVTILVSPFPLHLFSGIHTTLANPLTQNFAKEIFLNLVPEIIPLLLIIYLVDTRLS